MNLFKKIDNYNEEYWDFKGVRKEGVHKLGKYPATMVAPMQYELLSFLKNSSPIHKVLLDPFMGSATSLVEGTNLGMDVIGIDINPYAVLLSEVKTHEYKKSDFSFLHDRLKEKLFSEKFDYELYFFENINKWFREDIRDSLSKIREVILEEENKWVRKFLWICFSEVIYEHSNDRTSTFKLHIRKEEDIKKIFDNCIKRFLYKVLEKKEVLTYYSDTKKTIISGDSKDILLEMKNESIDIICTSPPYGDNGTTVTYGQATILFLKWIDFRDLNCDTELLSNFSRIDSMSLGGTNSIRKIPDIPSIKKYISSLSQSKQKKVNNFMADYYQILSELNRVLSKDGYMMFTVGNRRVDGLEQPLDIFTKDIFLELGLKEEKLLTRNILSKKMPQKLSYVKDKGAVKSMSKETVLIFRKI